MNMNTKIPPPSHRRPLSLDRFLFGACYYPEHWDEETRREDAARMAAAGFNTVRMAEFAAELIEPEPGTFHFELFDETIALLGRHGIDTILGTPTAAPPRWLTLAHPDAVGMNADGVPMQHGSRQHMSMSHPAFREYSRTVTQAMADHFADNPHVIGWQTDNEFHCGFSEDHSPAAQSDFQVFLRERYADDIIALNQAWGTVFWAQTYQRFEDIPTPRNHQPSFLNPGHHLDYARFLDWRVTRFQREQVAILRAANPQWFVFHNGCFAHIDFRGPFIRDLDFLGYDSYPLFEMDSETRPHSNAFNLDRARAWSGNFIIPEQQSGPGGQPAYFHDNPEPGEMRKMTYASIAHGADGILYFRWRTCRFGAEEYWCGLLDHDNIPRRRLKEAEAVGRELKDLGPRLLGTHVQVTVAVAAADFTALEAQATQTFGTPGLSNYAETLHRWFHRAGLEIGCVHPADNLDGIALYMIPHWEVVDPAWVPHLRAFVEAGGTLLLSARCGTRNADNQVVAETPPGCLADLAGMRVAEYSRRNRPEDRPWVAEWEGVSHTAEHWVEILEPAKGTEVLARWTTRHAAGLPAITRVRHGKGSVLYAGMGLSENWVEDFGPLLRDLAGVRPPLPDLPAGVEVVRREGPDRRFWFLINHTDHPVELSGLPAAARNHIGPDPEHGKLCLPPTDVAVLEENPV